MSHCHLLRVRPPRRPRASGGRGLTHPGVGSPAASRPIAGYLFDRHGTNRLAALLVVPIVAAAATRLTLDPHPPDPDPAS